MLVKWNPIRSIWSPSSWIDEFFNEPLFDMEEILPTRTVTFEPRIDVQESDKEYIISAELPGLDKKDFKLTLRDNNLVLEGEKKYEREQKDGGFYRSERAYGSFRRAFRLSDDVDKNNIKADYKNGVLTIHLPKTEAAQPKQIEVKVH
ncbi:MAG: Hsp20/alpha crystallin family protein [Calditrichaeota bacterium]|nr:MAG: Hsp20/alpha crystallin family protein [Calditrichota bacterium]